jgi:hypothetical protein
VTVTVRRPASPSGEERDEQYEYANCGGAKYDPNTGMMTLFSSMDVPLAMFIMTPDIHLEFDHNVLVTPQLIGIQ